MIFGTFIKFMLLKLRRINQYTNSIFFYKVYKVFCHLTVKGYGSFNLIISPFNWSFFFTFQISEILLHLLFVLFLILKLLPYFSSSCQYHLLPKTILCLSSNAHIFAALYNFAALCANQLYIFISKQLKNVEVDTSE